MTRTQLTQLVLIVAVTVTLVSDARAQISFGGGNINFGGSGRGQASFGRQLQSAVQNWGGQASPQNSPITDMRYRGPDPVLPRNAPVDAGAIIGAVIGSGLGIVEDSPIDVPDRPVCPNPFPNPTITPLPQPCPTPLPTPCPQPHPEIDPVVSPQPAVEPSEPVQEPNEALQLTYEAQEAFKIQNYPLATEKMNEVIKLSPTSSAAYQFRALTHFAQGDYNSAAADVYETLLRGPIWNWETIYPLYGNQYTYTNQYRALSRAAKRNQDSMAQHFLLAYHHLVLGHLEHGETELQQVLTIQPGEPVTQKLLVVVQQLQNPEAVATR